MARVLALDLGSKRIGVASSDLTRTLASPLTVVLRGRSHDEDHRAIGRIVDEYEPDAIVVGLPVGLDGREGRAAALIRSEVDELAGRFAVPVIVHDERFTTATAHRALQEQQVKARERRHVVDKVAAAVLLQSWLDAQSEIAARTKAADPSAAGSNDLQTVDVPGPFGGSSPISTETFEHPRGLAPDFSGRSGRRAMR